MDKIKRSINITVIPLLILILLISIVSANSIFNIFEATPELNHSNSDVLFEN